MQKNRNSTTEKEADGAKDGFGMKVSRGRSLPGTCIKLWTISFDLMTFPNKHMEIIRCADDEIALYVVENDSKSPI